MKKTKELISVIVPFYNEEEVLNETLNRLLNLEYIFNGKVNFEYIFIDDGSIDSSKLILQKNAYKNNNIKLISFTRNFGHQAAVTAGIDFCSGDYVGIIDADLQDPPELFLEMYEKINEGFDVVYAKRIKRKGETYFKKITAKIFYRLLNRLVKVHIPEDTGDFRLVTKRVVESLKNMPERNRFIRGLIPWLGYKSIAVQYERKERFAGTTKYPFKKMYSLAINAIISFTSKPIILATNLGLYMTLVGLFFSLYILYIKLFTDKSIPGITTVIILIVLFFGLQFFVIGLIGHYIAKIFDEVKERPLYLIDQKINI